MNYTKNFIACTLATALFFSSVLDAQSEGVQKTGDVFNNFTDTLIYVLPSVAFGMTLTEIGGTGTKQLAESAGIAMGTTVALKYSIRARRPNGDSQSFPSGHTAITVTSAEFMRKRYGWKYGVPAYVIAAYVGYDRIRTKEHYPHDVAAGAAISFLSTYLVTRPYKGWTVEPVVDAEDRGIRISRSF